MGIFLLFNVFTFLNFNTDMISNIVYVLIGVFIGIGMAIEYSDSKKKYQLFGAIFFLAGTIVLIFNVPIVKNVMAVVLVVAFLMGVYFYIKERKN